MVYLQTSRRVNCTDRRGKNREIQSGITQRKEYGTILAIERVVIYIGDGEPRSTGPMKGTEGKYEYSNEDADKDYWIPSRI